MKRKNILLSFIAIILLIAGSVSASVADDAREAASVNDNTSIVDDSPDSPSDSQSSETSYDDSGNLSSASDDVSGDSTYNFSSSEDGTLDDFPDSALDDRNGDDVASSSGMEVEVEHGITYLKPHTEDSVSTSASASHVENMALERATMGRILLQVERNGEAWHSDPASRRLAYLGRPADAFRAMREFGLGITNRDLEKIYQNGEDKRGGALAQRLAGRILLQVEDYGKAWYVDPVSLQRVYLGNPSDAFLIMSTMGIGISNSNLQKLTAL